MYEFSGAFFDRDDSEDGNDLRCYNTDLQLLSIEGTINRQKKGKTCGTVNLRSMAWAFPFVVGE
ncbi:MAG: hypothetical protein QXX57_04310 [Nitrososphaerota archaeon]